MPEPQPNQPQQPSHLQHLPNLGRPVAYDAKAQAPRDVEREAAQAHIAVPDWIKETIQLPREMQTTQAPVDAPSKYQFTLDPVDPATLQPQDLEAVGAADSLERYNTQTEQSVLQRMRADTASRPVPPPQVPLQAQMYTPEPQYAPQYAQAPQPSMSAAPQFASSDSVSSVSAPRPSHHVPPPEMGANPRSVRVPGQPVQHPVVAELLRDFGLRKDDSHTFTAFGREFCIREVNADILSFCMGQASKLAVSDSDMGARTRLMVAALSVVAINGAPLTEILPWNKSALKRGQKFDPWWPPFPVVTLLAESVFRFFFEEMKVDFVTRIAQEYDDMYGDSAEAEDSTRAPLAVAVEDKRIRFKCSVSGCGHVHDTEPVYVTANTIQSVYCPHHGVALTPIGYVRDLNNIPLA